jgi:hypothetical protein
MLTARLLLQQLIDIELLLKGVNRLALLLECRVEIGGGGGLLRRGKVAFLLV